MRSPIVGTEAEEVMGMDAWIDHEINGCAFADSRLRKRFYKVLQRLSQGVGRSLPLACQDWAATKAAYRFLDSGAD